MLSLYPFVSKLWCRFCTMFNSCISNAFFPQWNTLFFRRYIFIDTGDCLLQPQSKFMRCFSFQMCHYDMKWNSARPKVLILGNYIYHSHCKLSEIAIHIFVTFQSLWLLKAIYDTIWFKCLYSLHCSGTLPQVCIWISKTFI